MISRISWRFVLILLCAGAISYAIYTYLDSLRQTVPVVVAKSEIPVNVEVKTDMLQIVQAEKKTADTLLRHAASRVEDIVGGITLQKITAGSPIQMDPKVLIFPEHRQTYVKGDGSVDVKNFIPKDRRLMSVALDPESAVNNMLQKGDLVDVIFTSDANKSGNEFSNMILQQIEVFDVEQLSFSKQPDSLGKQGLVQHVTLLLAPQDAVTLALAKRDGKIDLALNPWNGETAKPSSVNFSRLSR
ncbi:Flp pilus assembly protein CpaB [Effusibacillus dendaii]|uniref:Flp pilus assembly protein RcpC/CpaB domain-containing protein n=1 Tax=Effusibacillus dendaii TaxID=2743772 RepID=A0A7I8D900_9BACL|nr:Flp pilus assembly protein CpaB [Effusibacillus dendaii]BCJ86623.1 hypothetical protein skT53_16080 [Effusibacillus dendaii]